MYLILILKHLIIQFLLIIVSPHNKKYMLYMPEVCDKVLSLKNGMAIALHDYNFVIILLSLVKNITSLLFLHICR